MQQLKRQKKTEYYFVVKKCLSTCNIHISNLKAETFYSIVYSRKIILYRHLVAVKSSNKCGNIEMLQLSPVSPILIFTLLDSLLFTGQIVLLLL
jgi:hypothetical protein